MANPLLERVNQRVHGQRRLKKDCKGRNLVLRWYSRQAFVQHAIGESPNPEPLRMSVGGHPETCTKLSRSDDKSSKR